MTVSEIQCEVPLRKESGEKNTPVDTPLPNPPCATSSYGSFLASARPPSYGSFLASAPDELTAPIAPGTTSEFPTVARSLLGQRLQTENGDGPESRPVTDRCTAHQPLGASMHLIQSDPGVVEDLSVEKVSICLDHCVPQIANYMAHPLYATSDACQYDVCCPIPVTRTGGHRRFGNSTTASPTGCMPTSVTARWHCDEGADRHVDVHTKIYISNGNGAPERNPIITNAEGDFLTHSEAPNRQL